MVREILTEWTTVSGAGKLSVMYFDETEPAGVQRQDIGTLFDAIAPDLANTTSFRVAQSGRELDTATGTVTGFWDSNTVHDGIGGAAVTAIADVAQLLLRWRTSTVINGRLVQGRTFVPGASSGEINGGNVASAMVTAAAAACTTFLTERPDFVIWHRPVNGAGGSAVPVTSSGVWSEWAVQRKRRN